MAEPLSLYVNTPLWWKPQGRLRWQSLYFYMTKTPHGKGRKMNFGLPEGEGEDWRAKPTEKKLAPSKVQSDTVLSVGSRLF